MTLLEICDYLDFILAPEKDSLPPHAIKHYQTYPKNFSTFLANKHRSLLNSYAQSEDLSAHKSDILPKYLYTKKGIFTLRDFFACLKKGIWLLTIVEPHKGMHKICAHGNLFHGAGALLGHDTDHCTATIRAFYALNEGFEQENPKQLNSQEFLDGSLEDIANIEDPWLKLKTTNLLFIQIHEKRDFIVLQKNLGHWHQKGQISLQASLGSRPDVGVYHNLVLPLCNEQEKQLLQACSDNPLDPTRKKNCMPHTSPSAIDVLHDIWKTWHIPFAQKLGKRLNALKSKTTRLSPHWGYSR